MTEQMQSQEEEMRQNMEELQATQEEIERNTQEMKNRVDAIDQSGIASIEFNMDGTITSANQSFLSLMHYELEEILGKHHRMFVAPDYAQSADYQQFWKNLQKGEAQLGEYERLAKGGSKVYIHGCYSILKDRDDNPVKVIKFATDITELKQTNEQVLAQEEQMRQNMEELLATQEEMEHKQKELEAALSASKK